MADDRLADGWGADDPADDTLVRSGVDSLADRMAHLARANGRTVVEDDRWVAACLADRGMFSAGGILTRPPDDWSWIGAAMAGLAPSGQPRLLVSAFPTPDLRADGLVLVGHPPFMVRPVGGDGPPPAPGLVVRRVTDADELATFERTLVTGYPVPDMDAEAAPTLFRGGYLDGSSFAFLGLLDGVPVATSAAHVAAGVNHVEFIATVPEARGRGIGAAMTWAATVARPDLPAVLIASDHGRSVYASLGYLAVCRWTLWLGQ